MTLKAAYDIKKDMAMNPDVESLQSMLEESGVKSILNSDRTIRIQSENGFNEIADHVDSVIPKWCGIEIPYPISLVYNLFPLSQNVCLLKV